MKVDPNKVIKTKPRMVREGEISTPKNLSPMFQGFIFGFMLCYLIGKILGKY
jgi:hypothetical protein